jgi:exopolyphosphatase/guanosine-5'-triphosphate,3'-diphosphate pyrophosphatase
MAAAMTILRDFRCMLSTYEVEMVRAVATSAVREARNGDAFLDRAELTTGIEVEVIEATEQSRLVVAAVRHAVQDEMDLHKRTALIVEVGGGSTVLTILRRGEISASQSYNLGSVRMREMISRMHEPPAQTAELLRRHIAKTVELARKSLRLRSIRTFLAIGGDARFAAQQVGKPLPSGDLSAIDVNGIDGLVAECSARAPEELARTYGLAFADAETLVPALLVYQALLHSTRASRMVVSQVSMRDGLLLDLPRYISGREEPALEESIVLSAKTIGTKYKYEEEHAEQVARLALELFDELQQEHGLGPRHRLLLRVAALLHEVGVFVSNRAHHKHSYYLVSNAELLGLSRDEIATVAHVARYHRRSVPKTSHTDYMALPRQQRMEVSKLAAILRVADCLDRGHMCQVAKMDMERRAGDLVIRVAGSPDLTLERLALGEKSDLFEDIFGMRIRLEESDAPAPPRPEAGV